MTESKNEPEQHGGQELIVVCNSGSTSAKLAIFSADSVSASDKPLWKAVLKKHADKSVQVEIHGSSAESKLEIPGEDITQVIETALQSAWSGPTAIAKDDSNVRAVGHRIVHGGTYFSEPTLVTERVLEQLHELYELAPLHQPAGVECVKLASRIFPNAKQIAVFDTSYFHGMAPEATIYPVPYEWHEKHGIRRYGFHGINHQYCSRKAAEMTAKPISEFRVVTCHLGGGASMAATNNGHAVATTMGFTPLDGLMMGTRSGEIDPGIILYLLENQKYTSQQIDHALNYDSGLKGVSEISSDVEQLQNLSSDGNKRAQLALSIYIRSISGHLGSLLTTMNGADAVVFSAGVGENSSYIREEVTKRLTFTGIVCDTTSNEAPSHDDREISARTSIIHILVINAQEEWMIAKECVRLLENAPAETPSRS